jgi:hypothetical protein
VKELAASADRLRRMNPLNLKLRALLRRLGVAERRWIRDDWQREAHSRLVGARLPNKASTLDAAIDGPNTSSGRVVEVPPARRRSTALPRRREAAD